MNSTQKILTLFLISVFFIAFMLILYYLGNTVLIDYSSNKENYLTRDQSIEESEEIIREINKELGNGQLFPNFLELHPNTFTTDDRFDSEYLAFYTNVGLETEDHHITQPVINLDNTVSIRVHIPTQDMIEKQSIEDMKRELERDYKEESENLSVISRGNLIFIVSSPNSEYVSKISEVINKS